MSELADRALDSWDVFEAEHPNAGAEDVAQRQYDLDAMYHRLFTSSDGIQVLEHLRQSTILQPTWDPRAGTSHGYAREGQNSIVRYIEQRMRRAELGPPTARREKQMQQEKRPRAPQAVPTTR